MQQMHTLPVPEVPQERLGQITGPEAHIQQYTAS